MERLHYPIESLPIIAILAGLVAGCAAQDAPERATQSSPAAAHVEQAAPALDPAIDAILTRLEDRVVRDLTADLKWVIEYAVEEEQTVKSGRIWYQDAEPTPKFKVRFTRKTSEGVKRDRVEEHLFDGFWYTEIQQDTKTLTRREIRRQDDTGDPYKLGEGAFILPFGQSKADILREFEVKLLGARPQDPPETDCLELTPRLGSRTRRTYATVELWIARAGQYAGLPVRVKAAKRDGTGKVNSYITISFENAELNTGFSAAVFKIDKPTGYQLIEEPLEAPEPPTPPGEAPRRAADGD